MSNLIVQKVPTDHENQPKDDAPMKVSKSRYEDVDVRPRVHILKAELSTVDVYREPVTVVVKHVPREVVHYDVCV